MKKVVISHIDNNIISKEGTDYINLTPSDMPGYISEIIENINDTTIIWIQDLQLYGKSVVKTLYHMGYKDVTADSPAVKEMPQPSFKYITTDKGVFYNIIIRTHKKTCYIYNVNMMLANLDNNAIIEAWGIKDDSRDISERLTDAINTGITMLGGFQSKKTPYTLSMVASRKWREIEGLYKCDNLVDCNKTLTPVNMTLAQYIRKSYEAGWNYLNNVSRETYKHQLIRVYDVNSLYPYTAATRPLPWGAPHFFKGTPWDEIKDTNKYYYFLRVRISFKLKDKSFPYIQKRGDFLHKPTDYISEGKHLTLTLTCTDWELIQRHYEVSDVEYVDGVYFRVCRHVFNDFVSHYYILKQTATDPGTRRIAKMIINGAIGTLAKRATRINVIYSYDNNGNVHPHYQESVNPSPCYIHIASAILSYAREYTYEAACANYDRFLYSDTDSIHLYGVFTPVGIRVDDKKLGAWKLEKQGDDAYYIKKKTYIIHSRDGYHITMAGVTNEYQRFIEDIMTYDDATVQSNALAGDYGTTIKNIYSPEWHGKTIENPFNGRICQVFETSEDNKLLENMREELSDISDKIISLQYIAYPTGQRECDNFNIQQKIVWMELSDRERLHPKAEVL